MRKSRLRLAIGIALVVVVAPSIVVVGSPAHAAISQCGSNRACAWFDQNFSGNFGSWTSSRSSLPTSMPNWHNNISSTHNRRTHNIGWFMDTGYAGTRMLYGPGGGGDYVWPHVAENNIQSLRFY